MTPSEIIDELLIKRGITADERDILLQPDFDRDIHDGLRMKGMTEATSRIIQAIETQEVITIFGDYDADGVPATALLVRAFKGLGVAVRGIIPTRQSGYGLTPEMVTVIKDAGTKLLITVDNGTVSQQEIADLADAGIDTIVCDHHEPQPGHVADRAVAILNPKQETCEYPFKELCGCALAWKLMVCLYTAMGRATDVLKWELDLVALSTIADMVPLRGENRTLVIYGLKVLRQTRNQGIKALAEVAGLDLKKATPGAVSFQLAPRINAPSRMHNEVMEGQNAALTLLTTSDATEAMKLAEYLQAQNSERQQLLESHLEAAAAQAESQSENLCLVLFDSAWSTGVIGLVAGRMVERYRRPVIVLAAEGELVKGSVRSVNGVIAVDMLEAGTEFLDRFGGHAKAAGLTMKDGAVIAEFTEVINTWMTTQQHTLATLFIASQRLSDLEISLTDATVELAESLETLEPFGIGWPAPLFVSQCEATGIKRVGAEGKHLSLQLTTGTSNVKAIAFGQGTVAVLEGRAYTVVYSLEVDTWNDQRRVNAHIQRIEPV